MDRFDYRSKVWPDSLKQGQNGKGTYSRLYFCNVIDRVQVETTEGAMRFAFQMVFFVTSRLIISDLFPADFR